MGQDSSQKCIEGGLAGLSPPGQADVLAVLQEGILVFEGGRVVYANDRVADIFACPVSDLLNLAWDSLIRAPSFDELINGLDGLQGVCNDSQLLQTELPALRLAKDQDGAERTGQGRIAFRTDDEAPDRLILSITDTTKTRDLDARLNLLSQAVDQGFAAVLIADRHGRLEFVNRRFSELTGYSEDEILGHHIDLLESGDSNATVFAELLAAMRDGRAWRGEVRAVKRNGVLIWLAAIHSPITVAGDVDGHKCVLILDDITDRKETEHQVWRQANFDHLTGLPNRILFQDRLEQAIVAAGRADEQVGLMFIDLNRFKLVNDTLGHDAGDELLEVVAGRLQACLRASDTVGRVGGDEFIVLLAKPGKKSDIEVLAQRILDSVVVTCTVLGKHEVSVGCSIGIALFPDSGKTAEEVTKAADTAMYRAKETGRNAYRFYTPDMTDRGLATVTLEAELRDAVIKRQFTVHYQPVVDNRTGTVVSAECLLRWQHPDRGLLRPHEFVDMATRMHLLGDIADTIFDETLALLRKWRADGVTDLRLSYNIVRSQVMQLGFTDYLRDKLAEYDIPADCIILEISEKDLVRKPETIKGELDTLRATGVGLAINDFGAGTLSLLQLRRLPIEMLKLDHSFVRGLVDDPDKQAVLEIITDIARSLDLTVVAGAVELQEQVTVLSEKKYDQFQGYLFGKPVAADDFLALKQDYDAGKRRE